MSASRSRSAARGPASSARPRQVQFRIGGFVEDVLRQDHRDRPRRAALRNVEGARDGFGRLFRLVHLDHQLGDVRQQPRVVLFLQRQPAEILALHLADQHHHRRRVVIRRVQRHHRIGQARPARDDAAAGAVAQPAVGHRHVAGAAFVPAHHHADGVPLQHRAGEADIALAGDAEDLVHVMRFQALRQQAGDGAGHCRVSPLR